MTESTSAATVLVTGSAQDVAQAAALADANVQRALEGKEPRKVIVVPNRIVNIVA